MLRRPAIFLVPALVLGASATFVAYRVNLAGACDELDRRGCELYGHHPCAAGEGTVASRVQGIYSASDCATALEEFTLPSDAGSSERKDEYTDIIDRMRMRRYPVAPLVTGLDGTLRQARWDLRRYSLVLAGMHEGRLASLPGVEAIRFLWLRSFSDPPVSVRAERRGTEAPLLTYKRLETTASGTSLTQRTVTLSDAQWSAFVDALGQSGFWQTMSRAERGGSDGADWILEAAEPTRYHYVDRWLPLFEPSDGGNRPFAKLCLRLIELADAGEGEQKTY